MTLEDRVTLLENKLNTISSTEALLNTLVLRDLRGDIKVRSINDVIYFLNYFNKLNTQFTYTAETTLENMPINDFTVCFWCRISDFNSTLNVIEFGSAKINVPTLYKTISFEIDENTYFITKNIENYVNGWYFIGLSVNYVDNLYSVDISINGMPIIEQIRNLNIENKIGSIWKFHGEVGRVYIFNEKLSNAEVYQLYNFDNMWYDENVGNIYIDGNIVMKEGSTIGTLAEPGKIVI